MINQAFQWQTRRTTSTGSWTWLALVGVALLAIAGCGGSAASPTTTAGGGSATTEPTSGASGAAACIDAETAAIIQSVRDAPAEAQTILTEQGDELIAGLQRFTPPPDATTWRDELIAAIEDGDLAAAQAKVEAIGSEVILEFC